MQWLFTLACSESKLQKGFTKIFPTKSSWLKIWLTYLQKTQKTFTIRDEWPFWRLQVLLHFLIARVLLHLNFRWGFLNFENDKLYSFRKCIIYPCSFLISQGIWKFDLNDLKSARIQKEGHTKSIKFEIKFNDDPFLKEHAKEGV